MKDPMIGKPIADAAQDIAAAPKKRRKPWIAGAALLLTLFAVRVLFGLFGGRRGKNKAGRA